MLHYRACTQLSKEAEGVTMYVGQPPSYLVSIGYGRTAVHAG